MRSRPAIVSGVIAALALFFAREPLIDMAGKLAKGVKTKRNAAKSKPSTTKPRAAKPRPRKTQPRKPNTRQKATETIA